MKRLFLSGWLVLALARLLSAQPSQTFENRGRLSYPLTTNNPPQIDALNFINSGEFEISFNSISSAVNGGLSGALVFSSQIRPFEFFDVNSYTNRGTMLCDTGFTFDNTPSTIGNPHMAGTFGNAGLIFGGSTTNSALTQELVFFAGTGLSFLSGVPIINVSATNVVNSGLVDVGADGYIGLQGNTINLIRGRVHIEGFDEGNISSVVANIGIQDRYWGIGKQSNALSLGNLTLPFPSSPFSQVTLAQGFTSGEIVAPPFATAFANLYVDPSGSNIDWQVVYVNTDLNGITTDVRFQGNGIGFATPIIQWQAPVTNFLGSLGQSITTNYLYVADRYGSFPTNYLITGSFSLSGVPQPAPYNYTFYRSDPTFGGYASLPQGNLPFDPRLVFASAFGETNEYAAYGVQVAPVTAFPDPGLPDSTVTNVPGRIQINANSSLDLTMAQITGPNYLNLSSTNHFVGSANAQIVAPYMDVNLGSTNSQMVVTNLVAPTIPRFTGPIDMWSGRWTNVVAGVTNTYHVWIVNAQLSPVFVPQVMNCSLRSPNVVVSDALNVQQSLLINADSLTISSNGPFSPTAYGAIAMLSGDLLWSTSLPVLQSLTNYGLISTLNAAYFYNTPQTPYYPVSSNRPYTSMLNHGLIASYGNTIWTGNFENTGVGEIITNATYSTSLNGITTTSNRSALIYSAIGPIDLHSTTAILANGQFVAPEGDITITNDANLMVSNHDLLAGYSLTLNVGGSLSDGGSPSNFWSVGDGMNLMVAPTGGSGLLGTTITNICQDYAEVQNVWAASDLGASPGGFVNNAAVGHLILNGGNAASQFRFSGPGGPDTGIKYAIYVDELELQNGATNRAIQGGVQIFTAFDIDPNFTIYYADATMNGVDISEKLNGNVAGGHCIWVPSYAGIFSSMSLVSAGVTNIVNKALAMSPDIDSNGDGIPNLQDPSPFYTSSDVRLSVGMTNLSGSTPVIRWAGLANSTNFLYYKTSLMATNWTLVTNFVQGPSNGTVTVVDRARAANQVGFYRVQVNPRQP